MTSIRGCANGASATDVYVSAHLCCNLKRFLTVKELYHLFNQMIERQQWSQI